MKKVVLKPTEGVSIDSITNNSIVGVIFRSGKKAYLSNYNGSILVIPFYVDQISHIFSTDSKRHAVIQIKNYGAEAVYLFDTEEEIINLLKS